MMTNARGNKPSLAFLKSGNIFGATEVERMNLWRSEKRAYFGLISPRNIVTTGNVHREYQESSMEYSDMWLQTVTNV